MKRNLGEHVKFQLPITFTFTICCILGNAVVFYFTRGNYIIMN